MLITLSKCGIMYRFLDSVHRGRNELWRYAFTVFLSFIVSNMGAGFIAAIFIAAAVILSRGVLSPEIISGGFSGPILLLLVAVSFSASLFFLYVGVRFIHKREFISAVNARGYLDWRRILRGALVWLLIVGVVDAVSMILDPSGFRFSFNPSSFGWLLLLALIAFPVQASFEEIFFRGYLMQGMWSVIRKPVPLIILNSAIFAVMHWWNGTSITMSLSIVISTFIIGVALAVTALADDGLELAMGVHIANNLYVSVIHSSPDSGLGDLPSIIISPTDPYSSPVFLIIASLVMILILFRGRYDDVLRIFRDHY